MPDKATPHNPYNDSPAKETVISMIISLALALVAKSYVVEAFVIPTGSMAPTLLGQHMQFRSPQSGYEWSVNPFYFRDNSGQFPFEIQGNGGTQPYPTSTDPMSTSRVNGWEQNAMLHMRRAGFAPPQQPKRNRAGDRILVHKWLYEVFEPKRFDVVVFKNPEEPLQNYIKRLIGLPHEDVWLCDGDVFVRPHKNGEPDPGAAWTIQRKSDRVQSSLWRDVFSIEYTPPKERHEIGGVKVFEVPWKAGSTGGGIWDFTGPVYRNGADESSLLWNTGAWPIWTFQVYNDIRGRNVIDDKWPISDLRLRAGVKPEKAGLGLTATITARRHEFQAAVRDGKAMLQMRPTSEGISVGASAGTGPDGWTVLAQGDMPGGALVAGAVTDVEFWHFDQRLELRINGGVVLAHEYGWSAEQRTMFVTGPDDPNNTFGDARLTRPVVYEDGKTGTPAAERPRVEWTFSGSPVTLYRVGLDKDVYYEPRYFNSRPSRGSSAEFAASLRKDQFFCCGDNSTNSMDGRMWPSVDPWIAAEIDDTPGVVHRDLLLGKAFFVYFPAPHLLMDRVPIPDFGRMRFIR
ncbi:MAG: signal peptidase I [Phycisphaerales bacterium]